MHLILPLAKSRGYISHRMSRIMKRNISGPSLILCFPRAGYCLSNGEAL
jgi:hypothetical protein